jgi:hypothetical protein
VSKDQLEDMYANISEADKEYVKLLILDCEDFHLNQKESLGYISKKLNRKISRTSYYNCKKEMSDDDFLANFCSDSKLEKISTIFHNITERNRILNSSSDVRIKSHNVWNDPEFVSKYSDRFFADSYALVEQTNHMVARINSQRDLTSRNYKSIPSGATIREEHVNCGKPDCNRCKHGPYFYAYWRENGKLKKKYIGRYDPRKGTWKQNDLKTIFIPGHFKTQK